MNYTPLISTDHPGFFLYRAQPTAEDCVLIVEYLRLLGEHQKTPLTKDSEAVRALIKAEKCEVYFGIYEGRPLGMTCVSDLTALCSGITGFYMEAFYIEEAYRGRGFGRTFMAFLAKRTLERGHERLQWFLVAENDSGTGFYKSIGSSPILGLHTLRMDLGGLQLLAGEFSGPTA